MSRCKICFKCNDADDINVMGIKYEEKDAVEFWREKSCGEENENFCSKGIEQKMKNCGIWNKFRDDIIERHEYCCDICNSFIGKRGVVHHIVPRNVDLRFYLCGHFCKYLCRRCHGYVEQIVKKYKVLKDVDIWGGKVEVDYRERLFFFLIYVRFKYMWEKYCHLSKRGERKKVFVGIRDNFFKRGKV